MHFCASVKNNHLGIRTACKSNEQKICGKIKCAVSIIKTTFLLACSNISAASSRLKDGKSSYLLVFKFCNVSLWHLKKSNFLWMGLMLSSITTLLFWLLTNIACNSLDWCGPSQVKRLGPKSKQTLIKQHVLGQNQQHTHFLFSILRT